MSIKRYVATADTTITDAYKDNLLYRGTGSNMGASDSLEIFSLYGQVTSASLERSRILIKFPTDTILNDRNLSTLPTSGNVNFYLKMYNAEHPFTLPKNYYISAYPLSQSWEEGYGLDMEGYTDPGFNQANGYGANWQYSLSGTRWQDSGSSFYSSSFSDMKQYLPIGTEDLEINITGLVEQWITGTLPNYGFAVKLSGSYEDGSLMTSFYTKKFFARGTQFFFKKPIIEARWDSAILDDRSQVFSSSPLLSNEDNTYNIYFYNRVNGKLKNIPNNPPISLKLYADNTLTQEVVPTSSSISNPSVGIYKASFIVSTTSGALYDKWYNSLTSSTVYYSGSFDVYKYTGQDYNSDEQYIINPINLKTLYGKNEVATVKIFSRLRDWSPNIYSVASKTIENTPIKNLYYKIFRLDDGYMVLDYSTGSVGHTKTSYDSNYNYFSFDMSILEPDYGYGLQLARWNGTILEEYKQVYKFRVE